MSRHPALKAYPVPADPVSVFDAVANAASVAAVYAGTAVDFAGIRDDARRRLRSPVRRVGSGDGGRPRGRATASAPGQAA